MMITNIILYLLIIPIYDCFIFRTNIKQFFSPNKFTYISVDQYSKEQIYCISSFVTGERYDNLPTYLHTEMVTITEKDFLNRYQSPASNNLPFIILVANKGEEIIGVITIECVPTVVANEEKKLYPVLSNLIVRKDMRRKGVAKSLTRRAESIVRARRYKDVYLYVDVENKAALQLYKSRGYKVTSDINETTKIACINKRFVNIKCANMLMRKKMLF